MTIEELKEAINNSKIKGDEGLFERGYNMAINHALKFIDLYAQQSDDKYPLGRNDWQE
jgi:hypothetical protein